MLSSIDSLSRDEVFADDRWTMKPQSFSVPLAARRYGVRSRLVLLVAAAALVGSSRGAAQPDAPGEPVTLPGAEISGWGQVGEVPARFGRPAGAPPKVPAVLILHGSGGVDGRGAFYAQALQDAGIATLEITMFRPGGPLGLTFGIATGIALDRLPRHA